MAPGRVRIYRRSWHRDKDGLLIYHVVLIAVIGAVSLGCWGMVRSAPWVLATILPRGLTFGFGAGFFVFGLFSAFFAAYAMHSPEAMIGSFIQSYVGLWFMLATSAGLRGSYEDERDLRRIAVMMGLLIGVIVATLYVSSAQPMAVVNLCLVATGLWLTRGFLRGASS